MRSLESFPEYVAASQKLTEVRGELATIEARLALVTQELTSRSSPTVSDRALKWLEGEETAPNAAGKTGLRQEYAELLDKKMIVSQAVKIQERRVSDVRYKCSEIILQECKPEYVKIIERLARVVIELGALNQQEAEFRSELERKDILASPWLVPVPFPKVGSLSEEYSAIRLYLSEVGEFYPGIAAKLPKPEKLPVKGAA